MPLIDRNTPPQQIGVALMFAAERAPFLVTLLSAMQSRMVPVQKGLPWAAVDEGCRLYYNPRAFDSSHEEYIPLDVQVGVVIHECGHVLREHFRRGETMGIYGGNQSRLWNYATDFRINQDLRHENIKLPEGVLYPDGEKWKLPTHLSEEQYMLELLKLKEEQEKKKKEKGQGGGSGGKGKGKGDGEPDLTESGDSSWEEGNSAEGWSHVDDQNAPWGKLPKDDAHAPAVSHSEMDRIVEETFERMKEHYSSSGGIGSQSAGWQRLFDDLVKSRINWRREIQRFIQGEVTKRSRTDYSMAAAKTYRVPGFVMPGMVGPTVKIATIIDTSGSMGGDRIATAVSEVLELVRAVPGIELMIYGVDAKEYKVGRVNTIQKAKEMLKKELKGGGGTDMPIGIKAALQDPHFKPNAIVVLTDGDTPWDPPGGNWRSGSVMEESAPSTAKPPVPILIVLVAGQPSVTPPGWARVVELPPEASTK